MKKSIKNLETKAVKSVKGVKGGNTDRGKKHNFDDNDTSWFQWAD
jgi:hypothetical protein